jgi:protein required for attachment to host cells
MAKPEDPSPAEPGPRHWFVIANGSRAQAYLQRIGTPGYDTIRDWDAPEARMTSAELGEDRPGRVFPGAGSVQRSGIESETAETSPQGHAKRDFEALLVEDLTQALRRRELSGLYLVAPAPMLHRLRDALPTDLRQALLGEQAGDFTQRPTADVFHHLDALRRGPNAQRT